MRKTSLFIALLVLTSSVFTFTGCNKNKEINSIVVATDATWPPMEMLDSKKNVVGYSVDFFQEVAKETGLKIIVKNVAWDGIFGGLVAGKYDAIVSSVTITDERKKKMDFSDPYFNAGQILVVPKNSKAVVISDLKGKKAGAQIGTTGAFEIKKNEGIVLKSYDEIGLAFADMAAGRIDGIVTDTPIAANYALQKDEYKSKFKIVGESFTNEFYGLAIQKGKAELLNKINKGIKAVKAKGFEKTLEKKWLR